VSKGILFVDDEAMLRDAWRMIFEAVGFEVSSASSPSEAMGLMRAGAPSDLVLSDVSFPEVSPQELASFFKGCLDSGRSLLVYTGAQWEKPPDLPGIEVLEKPCSDREMIIAVSKAWKARRGALREEELLALASPERHTATPWEKQEALLLGALGRFGPLSEQALFEHYKRKGLSRDLDQMAGKEWPKKELEERYDMFLASHRRLELLCGKKHPCVLQRRLGLRGGG